MHTRAAVGGIAVMASVVALCALSWYAQQTEPPSERFLGGRPSTPGGLGTSCANASNRSAFATLFTAKNPCYELALAVFLKTFLTTNSVHRMIVLHGPGVALSPELRLLAGDSVTLVEVPLLKDTFVQPRLRTMATKFQLWELTCFSKIAYYDADHIFFENADNVFSACSTDFCAVPDPSPSGHRAGQFNAGAIVIVPSSAYAQYLWREYRRRSDFLSSKDVKRSGDQVFLNFVRRGAWQPLASTFNAQHGARGAVVHDKLWKNKSGLDFGTIFGGSSFLKRLLVQCEAEERAGKRAR